MLKLFAAFAGALIATNAAAQDAALLERGSYLVNAVMACDGCHTPRGPAGLDMSRRFSGGSQVWDEPEYLVRGSNITPDRETGIGGWTADDVKRLLTDGKRPNGVPVAHQMPYPFYKILTPRDLDAVAAYTLSVPAVCLGYRSTASAIFSSSVFISASVFAVGGRTITRFAPASWN